MSQANRGAGAQMPAELDSALRGWRAGHGPLHRRLALALAGAAQRQDLLPGARLPPERVLAAQLGVARATVSAAYEQLHANGLVQRRQGRGTHLAGPDAAVAGGRAAELATSLQQSVLLGQLGRSVPDCIDLFGSCGPLSPELAYALAAAMDGVNVAELASGPGCLPFGYPPLRRAVAVHLTGQGLNTSEEEILVTCGAQQAITLLASCFVKPGAVVVTEDPTFPGAIDAFRAAGARVLTVPTQSGGVDIKVLAATLAEVPARLVYLMPTFHIPTGSVMSETSRREVARLIRTTQIPVIEDNTLAELALHTEPPPPMAAYARDGLVVSVGSLSKLFWPGLRIGWIRAAAPVVAQLGRLKAVADLGTSLVSQAIAVRLLSDADRITALRQRELSVRLALLQDLMERYLPDWRWRQPLGGLTIWAELPDGSSSELAQIARGHGVLIVPGTVWSPTGQCGNCLRLPFDYPPDVLEQGITRLARAWRTYCGLLCTSGAQSIDVIV